MDYAEAYDGHAAQGIQRIDAEIVKKSHFWMETSLFSRECLHRRFQRKTP